MPQAQNQGPVVWEERKDDRAGPSRSGGRAHRWHDVLHGENAGYPVRRHGDGRPGEVHRGPRGGAYHPGARKAGGYHDGKPGAKPGRRAGRAGGKPIRGTPAGPGVRAVGAGGTYAGGDHGAVPYQ